MAETTLKTSSAYFVRNLSVWEAYLCWLISRIWSNAVNFVFLWKDVMLVPPKITLCNIP